MPAFFCRKRLWLEEVDLVEFYSAAAVPSFAESFHLSPDLFDLVRGVFDMVLANPHLLMRGTGAL